MVARAARGPGSRSRIEETPMEARWLAYVGSGLLAALSLVPSTFLTSPSQSAAPRPNQAAATDDEPTRALVDVERQTARLQKYLEDAPAPRQPGRNPFRYGARPAPVDGPGAGSRLPRSAAMPRDLTPPTDDAAGRLPAPPQFRLIGMAEQVEGEGVVRTAVISGVGNVHLVRVGDRIGERYSVTAIGADAVELLDDCDAAGRPAWPQALTAIIGPLSSRSPPAIDVAHHDCANRSNARIRQVPPTSSGGLFHKVFHRSCEELVTRPWGCDLKPCLVPVRRRPCGFTSRRTPSSSPRRHAAVRPPHSSDRRHRHSTKGWRTRRPGRPDHSVHRRRRHGPRHLARVGARLRRRREEGLRRQEAHRLVRGRRRARRPATRTASGCRTTRSRRSSSTAWRSRAR